MKLLNIYMPVFTFVIDASRDNTSSMNYEEFHQQCILRLEQAATAAEQIECTDRERDEAFFAIVFWLDEYVMRSSLPFILQWRTELLQVKFFQTTNGGQDFFQQLDKVDDDYPLARYVYLFCLQHGFQGQYAGENSTRLQNIINKLRSLCLPEEWDRWPNNAKLVVIANNENKAGVIKKYGQHWQLLSLVLMYPLALLMLFLYIR